MAEEKRSATDILLSMEATLNTLNQRVQNTEYLLKALLGKTNKTASISPSSESQFVVNKDNFENRPKTNRFSEMAASQGVPLNDHEIISSSGISEEMSESAVRGSSRGQRGAKPKGPKTSVSQTINCGNSPVFLANIEVFDENNELISNTRTNTKGRWLSALYPGNYNVHILKRYPPDSGKKPIDTSYQITVPSSDKPLELDSHVVE
jgi:hypothetical protein